ncbi:MAG: chemotaxis protein CheX [Chloroflexota bacterium]
MSPADARMDAGAVGARQPMRVQLVNCYVRAAADVIAQETRDAVKRGGVKLEKDAYTTEDVTAMVGVNGAMGGSFFLSMSEKTALGLVSSMMGQECETFDELAQSGIAELANVVAGAASVGLSELGYQTNITPPLLLLGSKAKISAVEIQRLVVPLTTTHGHVNVHVALRENG